LVATATPEGERWRYRYDAFGRRVEKRCLTPVPEGRLQGVTYLWQGATLAEEIQDRAGCSRTFRWHFEPGSFRPIAKEVLEEAAGSSTFYPIVTDHLGTPKEVFDLQGTCQWQGEHSLWGKSTTLMLKVRAKIDWTLRNPKPQGDADCNLRFQNQWEDDETGLCYNLNRYYDPESGQYLSPDPIGLAGGLRTQGYVHNPVTWMDPLGLTCGFVDTPYGPATQDASAEAMAARTQVKNGAILYRTGTMGKSQAAEAQFWALENPTSPGYAARYGIPPENVANADFIETGTLTPGTNFVTRAAPPVGTNPGGGIEVVTQPNGVTLNYFGAK